MLSYSQVFGNTPPVLLRLISSLISLCRKTVCGIMELVKLCFMTQAWSPLANVAFILGKNMDSAVGWSILWCLDSLVDGGAHLFCVPVPFPGSSSVDFIKSFEVSRDDYKFLIFLLSFLSVFAFKYLKCFC